MEGEEEQGMLKGQAEIWKYMFSFADSMALKCAVELGIADIIQSHQGRPISLSQIVSSLGSSSPDPNCLMRIMRLLVHRNIFAATSSTRSPDQSDGGEGETLYGLTHSSRWLLRDAELSLAPMLLMENHQLLMAPWHHLSDCVREGGMAFEKAHGRPLWDLAAINQDLNRIFNEGLECTSRITMRAVVRAYGDGLSGVGSLVDVGGGTGASTAEIVKAHPHIKGINFDLPHVIAAAPDHPGVSHVGGDMFRLIPAADAVLMKWVLHDWSDEDCVKILKNCSKAIPEKSGKIIIIELILRPEGGDGVFGNTDLAFDLLMIAHTSGGMERTELQWKKLLKDAGFPRYNIIKIPALPSIIEAFPE